MVLGSLRTLAAAGLQFELAAQAPVLSYGFNDCANLPQLCVRLVKRTSPLERFRAAARKVMALYGKNRIQAAVLSVLPGANNRGSGHSGESRLLSVWPKPRRGSWAEAMEILIAPGEPLGQAQKDEIAKAFKFLALKSDGARHRQREGLPMKVSRALVPQLLRGCGRAVSEKQLSELMGSVEEEGILLEDFYRLYEAAAQEPLPDEQQLLSALRALDVTRSGVLDVTLGEEVGDDDGEKPKTIQTILCTMGDRLPQSTVDEILTGLPKDGLGRVSCQRLVRKLLKGPDQMPHL
eukprot:g23178.t1